MCSRNECKIFVGNLPRDIRFEEIENIFDRFGKILDVDLKNRTGTPYAFVTFENPRDAEDAVTRRNFCYYDGNHLRVEFPKGEPRPSIWRGTGPYRERNQGREGGSGSGDRVRRNPINLGRRSQYRVRITGLPVSGSWQDLKDHMREAGQVCFANIYKGGAGVVEYVQFEDMQYAIKELDNSRFISHEGETSCIRVKELKEDIPLPNTGGRGSWSNGNSYSPIGHRNYYRESKPISPHRTVSRSWSRSRSPNEILVY